VYVNRYYQIWLVSYRLLVFIKIKRTVTI